MTVFLPFLALFALLGSSLSCVAVTALLDLSAGPATFLSLACGCIGWCALVTCVLRRVVLDGRTPSEGAFMAVTACGGTAWAMAMALNLAGHVPFGLACCLHALTTAAATAAAVPLAWLAVERAPR